MASGGETKETFLHSTEYYRQDSIGSAEKTKFGHSIYLELIYQLNPHISVSVGNGYAFKKISGKTPYYTPVEGTTFQYDYKLFPTISTEVVPLCFSVIFSAPISTSFQANLVAGVGFYFGTFEGDSKMEIQATEYGDWKYNIWNFKGNNNALGYHFGGGLDIALPLKMFFTLETLYSIVSFNNMESTADIGGEGTFSYNYLYRNFVPVVSFDYRVSQIKLSGITFRTGLKFKF